MSDAGWIHRYPIRRIRDCGLVRFWFRVRDPGSSLYGSLHSHAMYTCGERGLTNMSWVDIFGFVVASLLSVAVITCIAILCFKDRAAGKGIVQRMCSMAPSDAKPDVEGD